MISAAILNESEEDLGNKENDIIPNYTSNTHRLLSDLKQTEVLDLLDEMPQYKSTFAISKVTGAVLVDCNSVKV